MFDIFKLLRSKPARRRKAMVDRNARSGIVQLGIFDCRLLGPDGKPVDGGVFRIFNAATTVGMNYVLDVGFNDGTKSANWYLLLISGASYTSGPAVGDTSASHAGWVENTTYTGNRPAWAVGTIASASLPTLPGSPAEFTFSGDTTVRGIGVADSNTKSSTTDLLWATAVQGSNRDVDNLQTLQVFYTNTFQPIS